MKINEELIETYIEVMRSGTPLRHVDDIAEDLRDLLKFGDRFFDPYDMLID